MAEKNGTHTPKTNPPRKKKKKTPGQKIVLILLIAVLVAAVVLLAVVGVSVWQVLDGGNDRPPADLSVFDTTPVGLRDKVAYYVFGLEGADKEAPFDALALICHDKENGSVQVLQIPVSTYIGKDHPVETVGQVWNNPKPLLWCENCRTDVPEDNKTVDGDKIRCGRCGEIVTERIGSSQGDLMSIFNDQMGMPVDQYFIMPHEGFKELVNTIHGIDVTLDTKWKVGDVTYPAGVNTLDGATALQYITTYEYKGTPESDIARIVRSRKVFAALVEKVCALESSKLYSILEGTDTYKMFGLQTGKNAIRTGNGSAAEDIRQIVDIFAAFKTISPENKVFYLLPGETAKVGTLSCYSMHRTDLAALLQETFNPYGEPVTESDLGLTELGSGKASDTKRATFAECLPQV